MAAVSYRSAIGLFRPVRYNREFIPTTETAHSLGGSGMRTRQILLALDEHIYQLRREKLKQLEALGQESYPRRYDFTRTVAQILAEYSTKNAEELEAARVNVRIAGRILAIRLMGKAGFAQLQQDGQRLQAYIKNAPFGAKCFEISKLPYMGNTFDVSGDLFRTRHDASRI